MLRVVKNVTWRQHVTNEVLYAGLPRISTTIGERSLSSVVIAGGLKMEVNGHLVL